MNIKEIEKVIFGNKNEIAYAPEAIDGGWSERPVSHYSVYERDGKFKPVFISVFNCYDGWDSMDYEVGDGSYDTYEEACFACYLEVLERRHDDEIERIYNEWQERMDRKGDRMQRAIERFRGLHG